MSRRELPLPIFDPNPERTAFLKRVRNFEDNFTERKLESVKDAEIRRTIVAFANSVSQDHTGLLSVGVGDSGNIEGVSNPDSFQKKLRQICDDCYPPIQYRVEVVSIDGKQVVVIEVGFSENKPHFSGPAYVRIGSESVKASDQIFEELILSRHGKPREILKWKDKLISIESKGSAEYVFAWDYKVVECRTQWVKLYCDADGKYTSLPLDDVQISTDETRAGRLKLIVR